MYRYKLAPQQRREIIERYWKREKVSKLAEEYGVSQYAIYRILRGPKIEFQCVYPAIKEFAVENYMSLGDIAAACDLQYTTLRNALSGKYRPNKKTIDAVLKLTGYSYEKAFRSDDNAV